MGYYKAYLDFIEYQVHKNFGNLITKSILSHNHLAELNTNETAKPEMEAKPETAKPEMKLQMIPT